MPLALMVTDWLIKAINQAPKKFARCLEFLFVFVLHPEPQALFPWNAVVPTPGQRTGPLRITPPAVIGESGKL